MPLDMRPAASTNGDQNFSYYHGGHYAGRLRFNPRTGDWHATTVVKGKMLSRYFSTEGRAATWLRSKMRFDP